MILQDIKEIKRYGRNDGRTDGCLDVKTVYPHKNSLRFGIHWIQIITNQVIRVLFQISPELFARRYTKTLRTRLIISPMTFEG